mmetsp:Transcript_5501/g.11043  ORF Transcript_5501/g.11043 Transcript_5501/m.11043 type:complete len:653 (+) Transcript_5501:344-2302(+)
MVGPSPPNYAAKDLSDSFAQSSCSFLTASEEKNFEPIPSAASASLAPSTPIQPATFWAPPTRLALSAFRRPECTVRLTDADPVKVIHAEYELLDPTICRTLGHGASSTVRLAYRRSDGQPVAVKTIAKHDALGLWSKSDRWRLSVRRSMSSGIEGEAEKESSTPRLDEVDVLTSLRGVCPNVVQLLDVYETDYEVHLVLEYCEGGDLFDCIKRRRHQLLEHEAEIFNITSVQGIFLENEASVIAKTLLGVLKILHERHIVHRDIKPENILLETDECSTDLGQSISVKLTDFGLARRLRYDDDEESSDGSLDGDIIESPNSTPEAVRRQRSRAFSRVGSDYYSAPEVDVGLGYDTPVDIYSLGITLYVMLCGAPPSSPFLHKYFKTGADCISDGESSSSSDSEDVPISAPTSNRSDLFPPELNISSQAQELICKMINPDPGMRITASEALSHEWITQREHPVEKKRPTSPSYTRRRGLSIAETETLLRKPIQGSVDEIAPPVIPPSNSPASRGAKITQPIEVPTPPNVPAMAQASVSVTLADVCSKLEPLAHKLNHHVRRRKHQRRTNLPSDVCGESSKKHTYNSIQIDNATKKRVRVESRASSPNFQHQTSNSTYANNRIGRRFNSPVPPSGTTFIGPMLPQNNNLAVKGAN